MNYRARWQQRRRKVLLQRLMAGLAVVGAVCLVAWALDRVALTEEVWRRSLPGDCPAYVTCDRGLLVCALPSRQVCAVRASTGRLVWPAPAHGAMGFGAAPLVAGRRVLCVNDDGTVQALARHSGEVLWAVGTAGPIRCPPLVSGGVVYVGSDDGNLYALDLRTGTERWRFGAGEPISSGCALARGVLVFGTTDGTVLGVDARTGQRRWSLQLGVPVCAPPTEMDDKVIVATDGGRAILVDPVSGAVAGSVDVPGSGLLRARPLFDAARLYLAATDGCIAAFDRKTLRLQWYRDVGRELSADPVMDQDYLYCGNGTSRVLALTKNAGRAHQRWECGATVRGSLVLAEGLLVASTAHGQLVAFRLGPQD